MWTEITINSSERDKLDFCEVMTKEVAPEDCHVILPEGLSNWEMYLEDLDNFLNTHKKKSETDPNKAPKMFIYRKDNWRIALGFCWSYFFNMLKLSHVEADGWEGGPELKEIIIIATKFMIFYMIKTDNNCLCASLWFGVIKEEYKGEIRTKPSNVKQFPFWKIIDEIWTPLGLAIKEDELIGKYLIYRIPKR